MSGHRLALLAAAARCMADPRNPLLITHAVHESCVSACTAWRWAGRDLNDHRSLRSDVIGLARNERLVRQVAHGHQASNGRKRHTALLR